MKQPAFKRAEKHEAPFAVVPAEILELDPLR